MGASGVDVFCRIPASFTDGEAEVSGFNFQNTMLLGRNFRGSLCELAKQLNPPVRWPTSQTAHLQTDLISPRSRVPDQRIPHETGTSRIVVAKLTHGERFISITRKMRSVTLRSTRTTSWPSARSSEIAGG